VIDGISPALADASVIVLFGSSSDLGKRLVASLRTSGLSVCTVSRDAHADRVADLETGNGVAEAIASASMIVSCAHAKFTPNILQNCRAGQSVVLTGSAWRYLRSADPGAGRELREAEAQFLASGVPGMMIHPTMIYGGSHENNVRRIVSALGWLPVVPAPGGGKQVVQPIFIDDVVRCLHAAAVATWRTASVVPVAGPPLTWRSMVAETARALNVRRLIVPVPLQLSIAAVELLNRAGLMNLNTNVLRRFAEDVNIPTDEMVRRFGVVPRPYPDGIRLALQGWRLAGNL
jgi:uncharacterized protein YbjT (DUF2867 family)